MHPHGPIFSSNPTAQTVMTAEQLAMKAAQSGSAGNKVLMAFQIVGAASLGLLAVVQTYKALFHQRRGEGHSRER